MNKRKSLPNCIKDQYANNMSREVGHKVKFCIGMTGQVEGTILYSKQFIHGTIIIVSNDLKGTSKAAFIGWDFVCVYLSEYSQSGVMDWFRPGSDPDLAAVKAEFIPPPPSPKKWVLISTVANEVNLPVRRPMMHNGKKITFDDKIKAEAFCERFVELLHPLYNDAAISDSLLDYMDAVIGCLTVEEEQ